MVTPDSPEWVDRLISTITPLLPKHFVGQIEINCVQGVVGNINLKQSFKKEKSNERAANDRRG